jgi:nicotinate-nucleotide pyrophosphorylase (carboxylating)
LDPSQISVEDALRSFLAEDVGSGDITTDMLIDSGTVAIGYVLCKEAAVIAGLNETIILLRLVGCSGTLSSRDGERVSSGSRILQVKGPARSLLTAERTMMNILCHMSGVATATAELVSIVKKAGGHARVASTRKTLPGLRYFEKKAVEIGGGDPHRWGLDDAVLIKDNHLSLSRSVSKSVKTAREKVSFTKKIEVEVTAPGQALEAARAGADIILLDNMKPDQVKKAISLLEKAKIRADVLLEASGGINKKNIAQYAKTGVDVISVGSMTHSARSIDMSLEIKPETRR